ncbi:MAG: beta-propeller fold lactonase family protein [Candidatus Binatus sp.]
MATDQRTRLSRRATIKNVVRLIPAVVIIAATLNTVSCGSNGLLTSVNNNSASPTSTQTQGTGALAFVTNYNDAKVSSFTRNLTTGALKLTGQVKAGATNGPRGVIASPNGNFLYVANIGDDSIYEFAINSHNGKLTQLAKVANGSGTGPDELAMNSNGTLLWVTNAHKGTVGWYTVNAATGLINLNSGGSIGGFGTPFGVALHPSLAELYVSDTAAPGLIQPMSYNTSTGALAKNFPAVTSASPLAMKPAAIAIDAAGAALFIADQGNGEASSFSIDAMGALTPIIAVANSSVGDVPVGVGIGVNAGAEYLFTANQGGGSVSSFTVTSVTNVITPPVTVPQPPGAAYNGPTGLVVDPQNLFVYTADNFDGTVSQSSIKGSCGIQLCEVGLVSTESPHNANSGPFGITLAQ